MSAIPMWTITYQHSDLGQVTHPESGHAHLQSWAQMMPAMATPEAQSEGNALAMHDILPPDLSAHHHSTPRCIQGMTSVHMGTTFKRAASGGRQVEGGLLALLLTSCMSRPRPPPQRRMAWHLPTRLLGPCQEMMHLEHFSCLAHSVRCHRWTVSLPSHV